MTIDLTFENVHSVLIRRRRRRSDSTPWYVHRFTLHLRRFILRTHFAKVSLHQNWKWNNYTADFWELAFHVDLSQNVPVGFQVNTDAQIHFDDTFRNSHLATKSAIQNDYRSHLWEFSSHVDPSQNAPVSLDISISMCRSILMTFLKSRLVIRFVENESSQKSALYQVHRAHFGENTHFGEHTWYRADFWQRLYTYTYTYYT